MGKKASDSQLDFLSPLDYIPGLGPKRVAALKESGISTIGDFLNYLPIRYIDKSKTIQMKDLGGYQNRVCSVVGTVERVRLERGRKKRLRILLRDETSTMEALWFQGLHIYAKNFEQGKKLMLTGKVTFYGHYQMVHPMVDFISEEQECSLRPFYPVYSIKKAMSDAGITQKSIQKCVRWIIKNLKNYPRVLPQSIEKNKEFPPLRESLKQIHDPDNAANLSVYHKRLTYEEFYKIALCLRWNRKKFSLPGRKMKAGQLCEKMETLLSFSLTSEQKKAIKLLYEDAASNHRMHRLLQGDVGSGKTLVAFFASLCSLNEGLQVAWMAPTEVLAKQTFQVLNKWLAQLGITSGILCGGISSKEKTEALKSLASGDTQFIVGTHALFMPSVDYKKLGMVIIDEQQRFGAQQRLALQEKDSACDFLLLSATPIPQTLAKTVYGDLDVVTLKGLPPGRVPVSTHVVGSHKRQDMEKFILERITEGEKIYYVVPRIDSCEDDGEIRSIDTVYQELKKGPLRDIGIEMIHGKMSPELRAQAMEQFKDGNSGILLATSIIEVGIDIPEATIMVIESGEYFGLSQLHQLRGRVGRGERKSYCFILSDLPDEKAGSRERLQKFCSTNDGFEIAEYDLRLRGPGEMSGFRQSGFDDSGMVRVMWNYDIFQEVTKDIDTLFSS
ncbi:ATP-dependent DNA helicase RecG [Chitinispirillum alkaliphilum]|nr:ATP-dependent DNA helicase RecG [Chitinispirillum alkaliphilum]